MEDVGFFESFWPLYFYKCRDDEDTKETKKDGDKKSSDDKKEAEEEAEQESDGKESANDRNSENDNTDNGFEVLDKEDLSPTDDKESWFRVSFPFLL